MSNDSVHDFIAAAAVPTNEQRMVAALEAINENLVRLENRLFAYINSLPKPPKAVEPIVARSGGKAR